VPRIVVVSNRIGPIEEGKAAAGGLAVGVYDILRAMGGLWFGWSGEVKEQTSKSPHQTIDGNIVYATIDLGRKDHAEYYNSYSNSTLWPLLHFRNDLIEFNRDCLAGYLRVTEIFADRLLPLLRPDDIIWVHDYHLIALGAALRRKGAKHHIGFFLHTPLPPRAVLRTLPDHRAMLQTLSAYDLVGFQTSDDANSFTDYMLNELGAVASNATLTLNQRQFRVGAFPIGIDTDGFAHTAAMAATQAATRRLVKSLADRRLVIGVDRLDYSKGLPLRLQAIDRLLGRYSDWRDRVTFLQIATLSRTEVRQYRDLRAELATATGNINGRYADYDWTPIRYVNRNVSRNTLAGFLRSARVGLVTPLRDGMNLVAKEYIAAQHAEDPGVLILSEFAGAAKQLDAALLVNPNDVDGVVDAIIRALKMSLPERQHRWRLMMTTLQKYTVRDWARRFTETLEDTRSDIRRTERTTTRDEFTIS
jgi:trehalose 6-phosphate synthase